MSPELALNIVDDDEAVRLSVGTLGESMGLPTQSFSSAEDFLSAYHRDLTGCLVTDLRMPGISGIELQEKLAEAGSPLAVILMGAKVEIAQCVLAMKLGAVDFLEKPCHGEILCKSIERALGISEQRLRDASQVRKTKDGLEHLSAGENQVLRHLIDGKSHHSIAKKLNLSIGAVEACRETILETTHAETLIDLGRMLLDIEARNTSPLY